MADKMLSESVDKEELLRALLADKARGTPIENEKDALEIAGRLKEKYLKLSEENKFIPGELIQWKDGLRNKKKPRTGEPAIVIKILTTPVFGNSDESGSAYFREPLDMEAAFIDEDGDFVIFHYDSRRFERFSKL